MVIMLIIMVAIMIVNYVNNWVVIMVVRLQDFTCSKHKFIIIIPNLARII